MSVEKLITHINSSGTNIISISIGRLRSSISPSLTPSDLIPCVFNQLERSSSSTGSVLGGRASQDFSTGTVQELYRPMPDVPCNNVAGNVF